MLTFAAWLHDLDPFLFRISGDFGIRWYGLSYIAGFGLAYALLAWLSRRRASLIPPDRVADAMIWLVAGVLIGGRLGYVLVYQPSLLWTLTHSPPWWSVLAINQGGMASHGAMLGVILAALRIARGWRDPSSPVVRGQCPSMHVMDTLALMCAPGLFLGRIANFINGELLGRIITPPGVEGPAWSVQFPQELLSKHAPPLTIAQEVQLSALAEQAAPDQPFGRQLEAIIASAGQYADQLKPLLASRHPSQLYQAVAEGLVIGLITWAIAARPRRPGVIGSVWLIGYGLLRIITEFWRLPDPQFIDRNAGHILGLSRGQWLSVVMVVIGGVALGLILRRRGTPKVGGWLTQSPHASPSAPNTTS